MAFTLSGTESMPYFDILYPKNLISDLKKITFLEFECHSSLTYPFKDYS
jgi:hypothetical protein